MSDQEFQNRIKAVAFDRIIPGKVYTAEALACLRADVEYELNGEVEVLADPVEQDLFADMSMRPFGQASIDTIHAYLNRPIGRCLDMDALKGRPDGYGFSLVVAKSFQLGDVQYDAGNTVHFDARYVIEFQSTPVD